MLVSVCVCWPNRPDWLSGRLGRNLSKTLRIDFVRSYVRSPTYVIACFFLLFHPTFVCSFLSIFGLLAFAPIFYSIFFFSFFLEFFLRKNLFQLLTRMLPDELKSDFISVARQSRREMLLIMNRRVSHEIQSKCFQFV